MSRLQHLNRPHGAARLRRLVTGMALGLGLSAGLSTAVHAHDTWFQRLPSSTPQNPVVLLGTGNQFPVMESPNGIEHVVSSGCRAGGTERAPLVDVDPTSPDLVLGPKEALPKGAARISCWTQLQPFEIEFDDELVELYFKEAQPPTAVREAWLAQKAQGIRWRERYVKHARIEWFPQAEPREAQPAQPVPMGMDALMLAPLQSPKAGDELHFQVLRNGQPLPNFSVEFRHHNSRFGVWRRTDAQGQVKVSLPTAGRWLLRGIELTPPAAAPERPSPGAQGAPEVGGTQAPMPGAARPLWQGQFITLAFDVR